MTYSIEVEHRFSICCAVAKIDRKEIKPGKFGTLKAVVLGDSIYGGYSKNIYVSSSELRVATGEKIIPFFLG